MFVVVYNFEYNALLEYESSSSSSSSSSSLDKDSPLIHHYLYPIRYFIFSESLFESSLRPKYWLLHLRRSTWNGFSLISRFVRYTLSKNFVF
ncbi:hypothetical protein DLAC_11660 [Tieghemostelium lacteum]|uniref:Uncharacterized protein n=1 Tax=Tieghemostelium lacteum TaxID=361077 RepID=A0A151ZFH3_TIELA|nr:hypothetical protein DLAC_11660 [Tieghemostelium lacteum]|eukprot:KYQ92614.1 hypothetical protein DLAC_11660 [Tieghemostelium lacteum]